MTGEPLYQSEEQKVRWVERNLLLQFQEVVRLAIQWGDTLRLAPQTIKDLHRLDMQDIDSCAGRFRTHSVQIRGSPHRPPGPALVEGLVQGMCEKANESTNGDALETAAFLAWKLNWIHPFGGGNGRTSRAVAYLALCVRLGFLPPGQPTIMEQIDLNRGLYLEALRDADEAWRAGVLDVSRMQSLLDDLLRLQLASISGQP